MGVIYHACNMLARTAALGMKKLVLGLSERVIYLACNMLTRMVALGIMKNFVLILVPFFLILLAGHFVSNMSLFTKTMFCDFGI